MNEETSVDSFERLYQSDSDPWQFAQSPYELDRYTTILEWLNRDRYGYAFEPGCSVGVLTLRLAGRCDRLRAMDVSPSAVRHAQQRCSALTNVELEVGDVSALGVTPLFDLIVFSEIGYYFTTTHLRAIACGLAERLTVAGEFVACHWLGHSADHVLHGDEVHSILLQSLPLRHHRGQRQDKFRIDSWTRS